MAAKIRIIDKIKKMKGFFGSVSTLHATENVFLFFFFLVSHYLEYPLQPLSLRYGSCADRWPSNMITNSRSALEQRACLLVMSDRTAELMEGVLKRTHRCSEPKTWTESLFVSRLHVTSHNTIHRLTLRGVQAFHRISDTRHPKGGGGTLSEKL